MKIQRSNFTTPRLCTCNSDLAKSWYVYFYYTDIDSGTKKIFRYKLGINRFHSKKERDREGGAISAALLHKLNTGWNPFTDLIENELQDNEITVSEAIKEILALKLSYLKKESQKTHKNQTNLFIKWLSIADLNHLYIQNFDKFKAQKFMDWLIIVRNYKGKAHNTHLTTMRTFFSQIIERYPIVKSNPFTLIKKIPEEVGKNITYSEKEENAIVNHLLKHNKNFYYITRFIKYCFIRRTELTALKIKDIVWENKTIIISSESSKGRQQNSVTIPKSLEKIIIEMGLMKYYPEMYVVGKNFVPGYERLNRLDNLTDKQREINQFLKIKPECTFYSWKHTGVCELYNTMNPKDPYVVMRQCRHKNIATTMIYLRSLGLVVNEQVREW